MWVGDNAAFVNSREVEKEFVASTVKVFFESFFEKAFLASTNIRSRGVPAQVWDLSVNLDGPH